jgi:uncharacterized membrane protein
MKTTDAARLVVVPWRDDSTQTLVNGLQTLVQHGVVDRQRAVVARWHGDDMCLAPAVDDAATGEGEQLVPRWRTVLGALFDHPVVEWAGTACAASSSSGDRIDLSTSFVREVRESILPGTTFFAFIVDARETSTIVHELGRVRATRMIYGAVPADWFTVLDDRVG